MTQHPIPAAGVSSFNGTGTPSSESSPSTTKPPTQRTTTNILGLGLPAFTTPRKDLQASIIGSSSATPYPHLAHYISNLLSSVQGSASYSGPSPPKAQHPLSVSSSGESDEEGTPPGSRDEGSDTGYQAASVGSTSTGTSSAGRGNDSRKASGEKGKEVVDKAELVRVVVELLDNEEEEKVKDVLRPYMGEMGTDDILMEQVCLDCMHRRKDDLEQLPFTPAHQALTPTRARLSPQVNAPLRPYTPSRVPSFRARTPLGRPQSPSIPSGGLTPTSSLPHSPFSRTESASKLPSLGAGSGGGAGIGSATSPSFVPGVPSASLSAKASAFNPSPRLTSPSVNPPSTAPPGSGGHTWIPADAWKDAAAEPPRRTASPFTSAPGMVRTASNLAIAAPLFSDQSSPFHSPLGTPAKGTVKIPDVFSSPSAGHGNVGAQAQGQRSFVPAIDADDDDDEFSPFGTGLPKLHHLDANNANAYKALNLGAKPFEPNFGGGSASSGSVSGAGTGAGGMRASSSGGSLDYEDALEDGGTGMTPLDVLHQVFTGVPRHELEIALHTAGYDFESAMALLVAQHTGPRSGTSTPGRTASPRPLLGIGGRGIVQTGQHAPTGGYFNQGGRSFAPVPGGATGHSSQGYPQPYAGAGHGHGARTPGGLKMCRFFLNGECRRSDCRFSHDLDRALCRFWLRGNCAKGPNCEFLHQLPPNLNQMQQNSFPSFDPHDLSSAMSRLELSSDGSYRRSPAATPTEEFPDLMGGRYRQGIPFDPSRNRFANALKRPNVDGPPGAGAGAGALGMGLGLGGGGGHLQLPGQRAGMIHVTGARMVTAPGGTGSTFLPPDQRTIPGGGGGGGGMGGIGGTQTIPTPKASSRLKLRAPTLLPTIKTGNVANEQYLTSRQTAIRLGHARNACLARAADAFRRGDGAAAKRFSREGKSLNERMSAESAEAAAQLVKERRGDAQKAVRERDPAWSDDPADRSIRGKEAGGGLGVMLGVAGKGSLRILVPSTSGGAPGWENTSAEERTECMCDLHTLHGNEGKEVLGVFLAELENERYRGLAYILVGEEKHVGTQDPLRGASKIRLGHTVKTFLTEEGYPWMEGQGWICVDSCRS